MRDAAECESSVDRRCPLWVTSWVGAVLKRGEPLNETSHQARDAVPQQMPSTTGGSRPQQSVFGMALQISAPPCPIRIVVSAPRCNV